MSFKIDIAMKKSKVNVSREGELTLEKLRTYKGFENSTEEEAIKQIEVIKRLAKIMYYMYITDGKK